MSRGLRKSRMRAAPLSGDALFRPESFLKEGRGAVHGLGEAVLIPEAVGAGVFHELGGGGGGLILGEDDFGLAHRHGGIGFAVEEQERGGVAVDVGDRGHGPGGGRVQAEAVGVVGEIGGRGHRDDGLHAARDAGVAAGAFEFLRLGAGGEHRHKVRAGGAADGADAIGVDAIAAGVGADPAHGGLAVLHALGDADFRQQAVTDAGGGEALAREVGGVAREALLVTGAPAAAVEDDDAG